MRVSCLLFAALLVFAAPAAAQAPLPVQVDLDYAVFGYDQDHSLVEVYLAFDARSLNFERDSTNYRARLPLYMSVVRGTDAALPGTPTEPVWSDSTGLSFVVQDTTGLSLGRYFLHQQRIVLQPGEYELRVVAPRDEAAQRRQLELRRDILAPDFGANAQAALSDVTLASSIAPTTDRDDVFYKNGLTIRPNVNQIFGQGVPVLYYYAEAYHPEQAAGQDNTYTVLSYVAETNRPQPIQGMQKRVEREARTPDVLVGSFRLDSLPTGSYFIRLALLNDENVAVVEQSRKFFVYNPTVERAESNLAADSYETNQYTAMPEEEIDQAIKHAEIVATDRERRRMRGIQDLDEKRLFLQEFWQKRDPNGASPINEFQDEFYRRIQYANERYSSSYAPGWQTDRGRVLVKYGSPIAIEPHLYDIDMKPYEVWQYNNIPGEGQSVFVFADRNGFGQFELIHSTVSGERTLPNWEAELKR